MRVKNPKHDPSPPHHLLFHLGFLVFLLFSMADANDSRLNLGLSMAPRGRGRPRGSKNKTAAAAGGSSSSALVKRRPGRPAGSKNKPKIMSATPGPSAPPPSAPSASPRIFSFFCIANAQCREI
jgi:hypothetical protein